MNIQVLKENLKEALVAVERGTAKTPTLSVLGAILLAAEKNTLELSATDLEVGIRTKVLAKTTKEGQVAVDARTLSQLVSALPEKEISLVLHAGELQVKSKDQETGFKTLPIEDFPIIPSLQGGELPIELEAKTFCAGLSQVVGIPSPNQARPEISGILVVIEKDLVFLVATDSFRLAEKQLGLGNVQDKEGSFILPQKTARELVAILGGKSGRIKMYLSPTQVLFDYVQKDAAGEPATQVVSRLIEGEYPSYQDVIPREFSTKAVVPKQELVSRLKAAAVFSGKMQDAKIVADPKKKGLEISSESSAAGRHSSFLSCQVSGEQLEISFNWRFLLEGLSNMKGEEVEIAFAGQGAAALIRPVAQDRYLYVVMPVKA